MRPDDETFRELARALIRTKPAEMTCDEWLDRVGAYAEAYLDGRPAPPAFEEIRRHLELCPECAEEFRALLSALCSPD